MAKPSLCKDFLRASWWTWHFMKRGYNLGLLPGEETITDNLLIYLAHRHQKQLRIYRLNKSEESKYSADWEWWFHTPRTGTWLGMRVQAKKLNPGTLRYESLTKGKIEQADNLIDQSSQPLDEYIQKALGRKVPMVPVYVFYNYWCRDAACKEQTLLEGDDWICFNCVLRWYTDHQCPRYPPGCTIADARKVREVINSQAVSASHGPVLWDLCREMFCWADLVCRRSDHNETGANEAIGIAEHVEEVLRSHGIEAEHHDVEAEICSTECDDKGHCGFLTTFPPTYVQKIYSGGELGEEDTQEVDAGFVWIIARDDVSQTTDEPCHCCPLYDYII